MPMRIFCEALGLPDIGEKKRKNTQTVALNTLLDSFCNTEVRPSNRQKISNIMFPHLRYFAYYIARGVLARDNTSNTSTPDTAIMENTLSGKHEHHVGTLIARRLATNSTKGDVFVASMPHFFCSLSKESRAQMMLSFLLLVLTWLP